jgi:hypothetical protein
VGIPSGIAFDRNGAATGAMGIDAVHFRNDDALAIAIGNFANEMTSFYVGRPPRLLYTDDAVPEGIGGPSRLVLKFGVLFLDADLDGRVDFAQANGHIEDQINVTQPSQHYEQSAQLFWNRSAAGSGPCYAEVPAKNLGDFARPVVGRGFASADIDSDGDTDLVITQPKGPALLLRNDQRTGHHWLRVRCEGTKSGADAIGAMVELTANGVTQRRRVMPTRSYFSQVELPVTFGLGKNDRVESLRVIWPDGSTQVVPVDGVDRTIVVRER